MNYKTEVSVKEIRELAESLYGPLYCSEAIVSAIRTKFELDVPEHVVAMASGFPVGIGGSLCLCGAVSGGIMSLGLFFGRSQPDDPSIDKMMQLAKEMHDWFKRAAGKMLYAVGYWLRILRWVPRSILISAPI